MTVSDLAAVTGLSWDTVKDIIQHRLEKDYGHPRLKELRRLSIDEICLGWRQKFFPLVIDLDTGRIVWVANRRMEGINNQIKTLLRQTYGLRDERYFVLKLFSLHHTSHELLG